MAKVLGRDIYYRKECVAVRAQIIYCVVPYALPFNYEEHHPKLINAALLAGETRDYQHELLPFHFDF